MMFDQPSRRVPITIGVDKRVYSRFAARAADLGYSPQIFAQLLFDAAYLARVQRDKSSPPDDGELDRQVVTVFALAAADPGAVADATGLPLERVQRILDAWRKAPQSLAGVSGPSGKEMPRKPADGRKGSGYTGDEIRTIVERYRAGDTVRSIAEAIGRPKASVEMWISGHRDSCPRRR